MKVFVMGMHRSGTSMVTGILQKCGLFLGNNLLMGARDNPKGHFEDRKFLNINNSLLISNGGTWRNPPKWISARNLEPIMKRFLASWPEDKLVGWKDPRICITFPAWNALIKPERVKIIFVLRNEIQIAKSLQARNGIPFERGKRLTKIYNNRAMENIRGAANVQYIMTWHYRYFENWQAEIESITEFLGLEIPQDTKPITDFIDKKLWHYREMRNGK